MATARDVVSEISTLDVSQLADRIPVSNVERLAYGYLGLEKHDVDKVRFETATKPQSAWQFTFEIFHCWKEKNKGLGCYRELCKCLIAAAEQGLIPRDSFPNIEAKVIIAPQFRALMHYISIL